MRRPAAALGSTLFLRSPPERWPLLPWGLTGRAGDWWLHLRLLGIVPLAAGAAVLLSAFVRFVVEGLGTPAPLRPPSIWYRAGCAQEESEGD